MKKAVVLLLVLSVWLCVFSGTYPAKTPAQIPADSAPSVSPAAQKTVAAAMEIDNPRDARLLHMLDLNRVFDEDFYDSGAIMQLAAEALIAEAETDADGYMFIDSAVLSNFVFNMYGMNPVAEAAVYEEFPQRPGKTLILPRGGIDLNHTLISVDEEENGILKVVSSAEIDPHDGEVYTALVVTRFAPCKASAFGWVIIEAEIL